MLIDRSEPTTCSVVDRSIDRYLSMPERDRESFVDRGHKLLNIRACFMMVGNPLPLMERTDLELLGDLVEVDLEAVPNGCQLDGDGVTPQGAVCPE
jgi:hypothetical protein